MYVAVIDLGRWNRFNCLGYSFLSARYLRSTYPEGRRKQEAIPPMAVGGMSGKFISIDSSCNSRARLNHFPLQKRNYTVVGKSNGPLKIGLTVSKARSRLLNSIFPIAIGTRDRNRFDTSAAAHDPQLSNDIDTSVRMFREPWTIDWKDDSVYVCKNQLKRIRFYFLTK